MFIPDPTFFHPGSELFRSRVLIPDPHQRIKYGILTRKIFSKLSEIRSRLFIPDPDPDFTHP
jgi:hypothetical protein